MQGNASLKEQTVENTMLIPLWARAQVSRQYPALLYDAEALRITDALPQDLSSMAKGFGEYGMINIGIRGRRFDEAIKSYISVHPDATIVNIGAGVDTSFSRVDNGRILWYDLDLPDAIAFRKTLIPETERSRCIAKSAFDTSWFDDVAFDPAKGILFLACGVFYYFDPAMLHTLVARMAERFPGGELIFDANSPAGVRISNRMVQKSGNRGAEMRFAVKSPKEIKTWSPLIAHVELGSYRGILPMNQKWGLSSRLGIYFGELFRMLWFIHIRFWKST